MRQVILTLAAVLTLAGSARANMVSQPFGLTNGPTLINKCTPLAGGSGSVTTWNITCPSTVAGDAMVVGLSYTNGSTPTNVMSSVVIGAVTCTQVVVILPGNPASNVATFGYLCPAIAAAQTTITATTTSSVTFASMTGAEFKNVSATDVSGSATQYASNAVGSQTVTTSAVTTAANDLLYSYVVNAASNNPTPTLFAAANQLSSANGSQMDQYSLTGNLGSTYSLHWGAQGQIGSVTSVIMALKHP